MAILNNQRVDGNGNSPIKMDTSDTLHVTGEVAITWILIKHGNGNSPIKMEKSPINGPCSIAMFHCRRVFYTNHGLWYLYCILSNFTSSWNFGFFGEYRVSRLRCNIWCSLCAQEKTSASWFARVCTGSAFHKRNWPNQSFRKMETVENGRKRSFWENCGFDKFWPHHVLENHHVTS